MKRAGVLVLLWAMGASAAELERVVLLTRPGTLAEAVVRLRAELKTVGFEVVEVPLEVALDPGTLARLASEHRAAAIIALDSRDSDDPAVDVWVQDRLTAKTVTRTIPSGQAATPRLLALRAVDLLQASLLELTVRPPVEPIPAPMQALLPPPPPPLAPLPPADPPVPDRFALHVGAGAAGQQGFDVAGALAFSGHVRLTDRFWAGLRALGPTLGGDFRGPIRASVQQFMFWADVQLHFEPFAWLELGVGGGAGPLYVTASSATGGSGTQWSAVLAGEVDATWWFGKRVGARATAAVAGAIVPVQLLQNGLEVGRATSPLVAGTIGVAVRL